jgi:Zn-dependent protease
MDFKVVDIVFQIIVFLFAISVHESAHAWMADRCGDPTAKMLGRITLNPIKHLDPLGSVLLPAIALISGIGLLGWAKPTPVTPENFKNPVRDDIFTTIAGPASNFITAAVAVIGLALIAFTSSDGQAMVHGIAQGGIVPTGSLLMPLVYLLYIGVYLNVLLGIFNLLPVPPLDGSHVFRHLLPAPVRRAYDTLGLFALILLFVFGWPIIRALLFPVLAAVNSLLLRI